MWVSTSSACGSGSRTSQNCCSAPASADQEVVGPALNGIARVETPGARAVPFLDKVARLSAVAQKAGASSSRGPGPSCKSDCANWHIGSDQRDPVSVRHDQRRRGPSTPRDGSMQIGRDRDLEPIAGAPLVNRACPPAPKLCVRPCSPLSRRRQAHARNALAPRRRGCVRSQRIRINGFPA